MSHLWMSFHVVYMVLIETLWNVNVSGFDSLDLKWIRINRNIVECKCFIAVFICSVVEVLIETLWNVNLEHLFVKR